RLIEDTKVHMIPDADNKNIDIYARLDHNQMMLDCDELKIKQVFINLIKNAIEAMESGTIMLDVRDVDGSIHIDVSDNGPGIPDNILCQVGEPFMTTKESETGLGLLISEKIIREHNGSFFVDTKAEKG